MPIHSPTKIQRNTTTPGLSNTLCSMAYRRKMRHSLKLLSFLVFYCLHNKYIYFCCNVTAAERVSGKPDEVNEETSRDLIKRKLPKKEPSKILRKNELKKMMQQTSKDSF